MMEILIPLVLALVPAVGAVATYLVNKHITDRELATLLGNAVRNSLGVVQQAAVTQYPLSRTFAGVAHDLAPGVGYVMTHAEEAVKRFDITPQKIAEKIIAQKGLKEIETNLAISASATPSVAAPLDPLRGTVIPAV